MQGIQDFLKHPLRETIYPKEILHGRAKYPRILFAGIPRIGDAIYSVTPAKEIAKFYRSDNTIARRIDDMSAHQEQFLKRCVSRRNLHYS